MFMHFSHLKDNNGDVSWVCGGQPVIIVRAYVVAREDGGLVRGEAAHLTSKYLRSVKLLIMSACRSLKESLCVRTAFYTEL